MNGYLLDTNVLSELRRPRPDSRVVAFVREQPIQFLFVSVVTFAELRFGIDRLPETDRRAVLNQWLSRDIRPNFGDRTLQLTEDILVRWRFLVDEGRKLGHTFSQPDLLIAATALHHGLTLVTRDQQGFALTRVPLLNPWAPA